MLTLQQVFEVALDIVENRTPWRCMDGGGPDWYKFKADKIVMGCFLGQAVINQGLENTGLQHADLFEHWPSASWDELMAIHDSSRTRKIAKKELLCFAEKYNLHIPMEVTHAVNITTSL